MVAAVAVAAVAVLRRWVKEELLRHLLFQITANYSSNRGNNINRNTLNLLLQLKVNMVMALVKGTVQRLWRHDSKNELRLLRQQLLQLQNQQLQLVDHLLALLNTGIMHTMLGIVLKLARTLLGGMLMMESSLQLMSDGRVKGALSVMQTQILTMIN